MAIKGKVAIVTGGASGLGEAVVERFVNEDARVVIADQNDTRAQKNVDQYQKRGYQVLSINTDVTKSDSVANMVSKTISAFGRIDILVNNAGIYPTQKFLEMTEKEWDRVLNVNLRGVFLVSKAVLPHMIEKRSGKIINISSSGFNEAPSEMTHYVASKAGVIGLTRTLAREFAEFGININSVSPGMIVTPSFIEQRPKELIDTLIAKQAFKRTAEPNDIVGPILFFADSDSGWVTGQNLIVDGGLIMD
jgi:3-oxoacyl-[acyl-carrier protein] reductase